MASSSLNRHPNIEPIARSAHSGGASLGFYQRAVNSANSFAFPSMEEKVIFERFADWGGVHLRHAQLAVVPLHRKPLLNQAPMDLHVAALIAKSASDAAILALTWFCSALKRVLLRAKRPDALSCANPVSIGVSNKSSFKGYLYKSAIVNITHARGTCE